MRDLETALDRFDGTSMSLLGQIEAEFGADTEYLAALIQLLPSPKSGVEIGATWLIKDRLSQGATLSQARSDQLAGLAPALEDWQAKLHLLQTVRYLTPSRPAARILYIEINTLLSHERPFLRAWAVDAACHLAALFEEFAAGAKEALKAAAEDPAASVRARARALT